VKSVLIVTLLHVGGIVGQTPQQATISVTAALVADELQIRPVALHELRLVRQGDTGVVLLFRTGLDGKAKQAVPPGSYRLRSASAVDLLGKTYRWDVPVTTVSGKLLEVELTNVNAIVDAANVSPEPAQVAPEVLVRESSLTGDSLEHIRARLFARYDSLHRYKQDERAVLDSLHRVTILMGQAAAHATRKCREEVGRLQYETERVTQDYWRQRNTKNMLNRRATDGWELVSFHEESYEDVYIFKRQTPVTTCR